MVLASCSSYFQAMFTSGYAESQWSPGGPGDNKMQEISLPGISAGALRDVLEFVYSGSLELSPTNIQSVLATASQLQVQSVISLCSRYLHNNLDLDNCADILSLADTFCLPKLKHNVLRFISENLKQFCSRSEFLTLEPGQLSSLLNSNFPVNLTECEVLSATADWLEHDLGCRLTFSDELVAGVRLDDIPSRDMAGMMDRPGLRSMKDKLAALERLSPLRQSDTYKMVNSRGMEMAVVRVGGFGTSGITNSISYYHINHKNGAWRHLTSVPHVECCNFGVAVLHNLLYVVGGCFNQGLQENIHPFGFCYNPRQDKWTTTNAMIRERCRFTLTECRGKLYAVGGSSETPELEDEVSCEVFSPDTDSWTVCRRLPGGNRTCHAAVKMRDKILVCGGLDQDTVLDTLLEYDPGLDSWRLVTRLPRARADHGVLVQDDVLYVVGGWRDTGEGRVLVREVDRYDLQADIWTVETLLPTPRYHAGLTKVAGKIFVIGGFLDDEMIDRAIKVTGECAGDTEHKFQVLIADCYDLNTGRWTLEAESPVDLWEHACCSLNVPVCRDDPPVLESSQTNSQA